MDPSVSGSALAALGEDLFLLSIRPRDGKLMTRGRIDSALMASELVRLAAAGRAWITEGRIVAEDRTATGDTELDAALLSLAGAAFPPRPEAWVGLPRRGIRAAYAARLISAGVLRLEPSRVLGVPRYQVTGLSRVAVARSRLDAITRASGTPAGGRPAEPAQTALAGLASAIGLGDVLYPGREGRAARTRMAQIARRQVIAQGTAARGSGVAQLPPAGPAAGPAAREPLRDSAAEEGPAPALLPAMDEVVAATVHALTAVIDNGAIVASEAVGTNVGGIHLPGAHGAAGDGGEGHHAGGHGDGGHAGGFGHH
jgi:Golgi phosphoprotein 3 (GPP34)